MTWEHCCIPLSPKDIMYARFYITSIGRKINSKTCPKPSQLWIGWSFRAAHFPFHLTRCRRGTESRATWRITTIEGFDVIIKSMFPKLKHTLLSVLSCEEFERWVWSELRNNGTLQPPHNHLSYLCSQIIIAMTKFNCCTCSFHHLLLGFISELICPSASQNYFAEVHDICSLKADCKIRNWMHLTELQ